MINYRYLHRSFVLRSNHNSTSLPKNALKKEKVTKKNRDHYSNDELLSKFPKEFHRKTSPNSNMSRQLYLVNETTVKKIAAHLTRLPNQNITFVETNPGLGMLTALLLKSDMKDLRLFEGNEGFMAHLQQTYAENYPDRVKLKHADLISLYKVLHSDDLSDGTRVDEILSALPTTEWRNDINFRLFGATGSTSFFKQLISSIVFQNSILALGRYELYMVIPSTMYLTLASSKRAGYANYRPISILFQIFFEYEILDTFSKTDFLPYITSPMRMSVSSETTRRRPSRAPVVDLESMYFVKIIPRRDLHQLCPPNQVQELWHFIRLNCHSRQNRIILLLEKLIPGCGAKLLLKFTTGNRVRPQPINETILCEPPPETNPSTTLSNQDYYDDLNIFTQFGDLQPTELFTLFQEFRNLPEYFSCNFLPSMESVLLKSGALGNKFIDAESPVMKPINVSRNEYVEMDEENECSEVNVQSIKLDK